MKALFAMSLVGLVLVVTTLGSGILEADFKSSFLVDGRALSSLSYLSDDRDDEWRKEVRSIVLSNGDTHFDMLARNTDEPWGVVNGINTHWAGRLDDLNNSGLAPVIWLRGDDSPEIDALGLGNQLDYNDAVVAASDDRISHYVIALEADEYYTVPEVRVLLQRMRQKTDKPIGIHLTPGTRGKEAYLEGFDIYYLQTGFNLTEAEFRAEVEYAVSLGMPVVVSEYHMDNMSAEAKHLGNIACGYPGVVGTGNGRGSAVCEDLKWEAKERFHSEYRDELSVFMLALVTLSATQMLNLPFVANYNWVQNDNYEVMLAVPVTEDLDVGMTYRDDGRIMTFLRGTFDNLFKGSYANRSERDRK
jgi:hypothetical protein